MFTVLFEVHPAPGQQDAYLKQAAHLKPLLEAIPGFIDNERYASTTRDGWVLSLSTWEDEKALVRWRTQGEHHAVQRLGRDRIFSDYHLRVCEVLADSHSPVGRTVIEQRLDTTVTGEAKAVSITELTPATDASLAQEPGRVPGLLGLDLARDGLIGQDVFASITHPGKLLLMASWRSRAAAGWTPRLPAGVAQLRQRCVRNLRDYGIGDRREAPQYFPAAGSTTAP